MIDSIISAIISVLVVFSLMRLAYGAWPWEFEKTWYVTRQRLKRYQATIIPEGISLSEEQMKEARAAAVLANTAKRRTDAEDEIQAERAAANSNEAGHA
jgi:hypothetical protein